MAVALYSEARAEPIAGKYAVATVIMNRVNDPRFPKNICQVVKQGSKTNCQFTGLCQPNVVIDKNQDQWEKCLHIAKNVVNKKLLHFTVAEKKALWFHNETVSPEWNKRKVLKIGGHIFYS